MKMRRACFSKSPAQGELKKEASSERPVTVAILGVLILQNI